jgi:hypothetical protein
VLGLPPAFVLSQDQTLKLKSVCTLILDVRTPAHRPGVQPGQFSVCCASGFHKKTRNRPNSEADTGHRVLSLLTRPYQRDIQEVDPSNEPNRPHISSDTINFKQRRDKINRMRPNLFGAPRLYYLCFFCCVSLPCGPVGTPWSISAPPVRGVLRLVGDTRNPFFAQSAYFLIFSSLLFVFKWLE